MNAAYDQAAMMARCNALIPAPFGIGARVMVRRDQDGLTLSPQRPGRRGVIVRASMIDPTEYVYVRLEPTRRARAREELFRLRLLLLLPEREAAE